MERVCVILPIFYSCHQQTARTLVLLVVTAFSSFFAQQAMLTCEHLTKAQGIPGGCAPWGPDASTFFVYDHVQMSGDGWYWVNEDMCGFSGPRDIDDHRYISMYKFTCMY